MNRAEVLSSLLEDARKRGFLGPAALDEQLEHSHAFVEILRELLHGDAATDAEEEKVVVDLGTGGGLPGLVIAAADLPWRLYLVESSERRAGWLRHALDVMACAGEADVLGERAEVAGRREDLRSRSQAVTSRLFGPPSVVAECAAPLLAPGGWLVVSEPPVPDDAASGGERWPAVPLGELGLAPPIRTTVSGRHFVVLQQVSLCPGRYPRRTGIPSKRPLW